MTSRVRTQNPKDRAAAIQDGLSAIGIKSRVGTTGAQQFCVALKNLLAQAALLCQLLLEFKPRQFLTIEAAIVTGQRRARLPAALPKKAVKINPRQPLQGQHNGLGGHKPTHLYI